MKIIKTIGILLIVAIAIAMILMLVLPTKQHIERTITINAPAAKVYQYLTSLENFNKWSVWSRNDSILKNTIIGTDGSLGAISTWSGDPELSGEGKIEVTSLEINREIEHTITFLKPRQMNAHSEFDLEEINGQTKVRWQIDIATPRPWNIFNLFSNMDKKMGNDFSLGLQQLKNAIEGKSGESVTIKTYKIQPLNFPATTFAAYRDKIKWEDIPVFYSTWLPRIAQSIVTANSSPRIPTGLYYVWDEKNKETDIAVAFEIPSETHLNNDSLQVITIPASKAVYTDHFGAYDKSKEAYTTLDKYLVENNLKQKAPVIEQFMNDPSQVKDTTKWHTKIILLVE